MMSDNIDDEQEVEDEKLNVSDLKKKAKSLKIVIENEDANKGNENEELFDYEELKDEEMTGDVAKMELDVVVAEEEEEDEDSTEFHVNLNKAPPTLQNTVLVRENKPLLSLYNPISIVINVKKYRTKRFISTKRTKSSRKRKTW